MADASCNADKSDLLTDVAHLDKWQPRDRDAGDHLVGALEARGVVSDLAASVGIAQWAYERARVSAGIVWTRRGTTRLIPVDARFAL